MEGKKKFTFIVILGMLSAIGPFSIDMYLPAFPDIATSLQTTVARISYSLSSFFIGISIGQVIYGPLLDRFGRKKPLYVGLMVYMAASAGCAVVNTADGLIALRFVQALGSCAGMVASRAMVRDLFPVHENAKVFSMLMLVIGVSPIIAPTMGGYLTAALGWHSLFIVLTVMSALIMAAVYFVLPETRAADTSYSLRPAAIAKSFWGVLRQPQFMTYALTGAVSAAGLYAYIAGSPAVFMEIFKLSEREYGWIFAFVAGGLILSSQINTILLKKYKSEQIIPIALACQTIIGILLFLGSLQGWLGLVGTVILILLFLSCQGFTFPNSSALSMAPFTRNAGSASAMMGTLQMSIGALTSALVSYFNNHTALPMTITMLACSATSFCILMGGSRILRYRASAEKVKEETVDMISTS